jgi:prevent-host-death family protein
VSSPTPPRSTVTVTELHDRAAEVIDQANETGRPIAVTRHGRFVAAIYPLANVPVESIVLRHGPIAEEIARRAREADAEEGYTTDEVARQVEAEPALTCPICGEADVHTISYNHNTKNMRVQHGGDISCTRAPVDEHGNYLQKG